ncbi:MAG: phosphonate ABC transporter ATP-binding protein [Chloroflexi bacterium]|nr:phosphonate ABC transporter ATP-binding protein [Chloroflexota bacterium]
MIQLAHIEVAYGCGRPVLAVESLRIAPGERVAIIGPSGAGKSTLLRCLKGFVQPRRGKVEVLGVNLACACQKARRAANQRVALIYQQFRLVSRLTVLQNTLCGRLGHTSRWRSLFGKFSAEDLRVAWAAIVEVGLAEKVRQRADTLSGGEQQRVAVARALAQEPELILADEPVSSLDPAWADDVLELLTTVQSHHHATLVMTLHQPELARRFAERVIGLRAGRITWDGPAHDLTDEVLKTLYGNDRHDILPFADRATA